MVKISKNDPKTRVEDKLVVFCPECQKQLKIIVSVDYKGNKTTMYRCGEPCNFSYPMYKKSYQDLVYKWVKIK